MRHSILIIQTVLLLLLFSASAFAGEETVIYLRNNAIALSAPTGWVLDEEAGRPRIQAVFYPEGSTFAEAEAVMYVNTLSRTVEPNLEAFIADDVAREKEDSPNLQVRRAAPVRLSDGKSAIINQLSGDKFGNFESIAYIDSPADYIAIVLTSKTEAGYKKSEAAFLELLKSYRVLGPGGGL